MIMFDLGSFLLYYLRPLIKWFLRKTTRLCELQRICYGDMPGAARTCSVERSLMLSRTRDVKEVVNHLDTVVYERRFTPLNFRDIVSPSVAIILRAKKINPIYHKAFIISFRKCIEQIWSYRSLADEVEDLRKTQFDSNNEEHERRLLQLWSLLVPNEELESRVTKQWQYIGFQVRLNIVINRNY